jgi:hypothetical protein
MKLSPNTISSVAKRLRAVDMAWAFAVLLPLPVLLAMDHAKNADVSCIYLGIANAWLATEIFLCGDLPTTSIEWREKLLALCCAVFINLALFVVLGMSVSVQSNLPFALLATLSTAPAVGLAPWLVLRLEGRYAAIILGIVLVGLAKFSACTIALMIYGSDYVERGYSSGDWNKAKLMISLFWLFTVVMSLGAMFAGYRWVKRRELSALHGKSAA